MLVNYYQDQEEKRLFDLFVAEAVKNYFQNFATKDERKRSVSKHQLRKFYNEVLVYKSRTAFQVRILKRPFKRIYHIYECLPQLAFYAKENKSRARFSFVLTIRIQYLVHRDFEVFTSFFEAIAITVRNFKELIRGDHEIENKKN